MKRESLKNSIRGILLSLSLGMFLSGCGASGTFSDPLDALEPTPLPNHLSTNTGNGFGYLLTSQLLLNDGEVDPYAATAPLPADSSFIGCRPQLSDENGTAIDTTFQVSLQYQITFSKGEISPVVSLNINPKQSASIAELIQTILDSKLDQDLPFGMDLSKGSEASAIDIRCRAMAEVSGEVLESASELFDFQILQTGDTEIEFFSPAGRLTDRIH